MRKQMSLFTRTYLILSIILTLGFMMTLLIIDNSFENEDGRIFKAEALAEARLASQWLQQHPSGSWPTVIQDYPGLLDFSTSVLSAEQLAGEDIIEGGVLSGNTEQLQVSTAPWEAWWLIYRIANSEYYLLIEEGEEPPFALDDWLEITLPFVSLFVVLGIGITLLSRNLESHIHKLINTTSAIGAGDWDVRASTHIPEPVKSLAISVNAMAEKLQRTLQDQQIAIGAIPHEIRSPIGRMRFALDMTQQSSSLEEVKQRIEDIDHYLDDLNETVECTLDLIRQAQEGTLPNSQLSATTLATELSQHYDLEHDFFQGMHFAITVTSSEMTHGDLQSLKQASINLINNALRYGKSKVSVTISTSPEGSFIIVSDDGEGVPVEHWEDILSPFYRIDKSRTRNTGGTGLGLALVRLVAEQHKGTIKVSNSPQGGAQFTLRW